MITKSLTRCFYKYFSSLVDVQARCRELNEKKKVANFVTEKKKFFTSFKQNSLTDIFVVN